MAISPGRSPRDAKTAQAPEHYPPMTIARYLKRLDAKLDEMSSVIVSSGYKEDDDGYTYD